MAAWTDLMFEIKEAIIQKSTAESRRMLKACSSKDRELINTMKVNSISMIQIGYGVEDAGKPNEWSITVCKFPTPPHLPYPPARKQLFTFTSFEEFQKELNVMLRSLHCVESLVVCNLNTDVPLKLLSLNSSRRRLLVEHLNINVGNGEQLENIISQIEPVYLSNLLMASDEGNNKIYDMPQVVNAESVKVCERSSIREDQLLKLEARTLFLGKTSCSIKKFIEKCAVEASTKFSKFHFGGWIGQSEVKLMRPLLNKKVSLKTKNPRMRFEVDTSQFEVVTGCVRFKSEVKASIFSRLDPLGFREILNLSISYKSEERYWLIEVERKTHNAYNYKLTSASKAQQKIDEILSKTDKIRNLKIILDNAMFFLKWRAREKKLLVSHLKVDGYNSVTGICELLPQIDPFFIKSIAIKSGECDEWSDRGIFNMPQICHSQKVVVAGSPLLDEHLLNIKAEYFHSYFSTPITPVDQYYKEYIRRHTGTQNLLLTASGLNKYMKYCLLDSDEKRHSFRFDLISPNLDRQELFDDFVILDRSVSTSDRKLITLPGSEFVMHVVTFSNSLTGVRQKLDEPLPPDNYLYGFRPLKIDNLHFDHQTKTIWRSYDNW